jgi:hypothetical protein
VQFHPLLVGNQAAPIMASNRLSNSDKISPETTKFPRGLRRTSMGPREGWDRGNNLPLVRILACRAIRMSTETLLEGEGLHQAGNIFTVRSRLRS